jgi:hypothetical protein
MRDQHDLRPVPQLPVAGPGEQRLQLPTCCSLNATRIVDAALLGQKDPE